MSFSSSSCLRPPHSYEFQDPRHSYMIFMMLTILVILLILAILIFAWSFWWSLQFSIRQFCDCQKGVTIKRGDRYSTLGAHNAGNKRLDVKNFVTTLSRPHKPATNIGVAMLVPRPCVQRPSVFVVWHPSLWVFICLCDVASGFKAWHLSLWRCIWLWGVVSVFVALHLTLRRCICLKGFASVSKALHPFISCQRG